VLSPRRGRCAGDAKDDQKVRAERDRASSEIGDEEADCQAIGKLHSQELRHDGWAARKHGHHPDRSLLVFFHQGRRLHLLMGAKRGNIEAPLQASGAQRGEELVLIVEPLVVAAVVRQQHVHDGTGDEYDDGRQQHREQRAVRGTMRSLLRVRGRMPEFQAKLRLPGAAVKRRIEPCKM